jgi:hypothetical protein
MKQNDYDILSELANVCDPSDDGNSIELTVVPKATQKAKTGSSPFQLPDVQHILDQLVPNRIPESVAFGSDPTIPTSMDRRDNV